MNLDTKYSSSSFRWTEWETSIWAKNNPDDVVQIFGPVQKAWAIEVAIASGTDELNRMFGISAPIRIIPDGLNGENFIKGIEIVVDQINEKYFKKVKKIEKIKQKLIINANKQLSDRLIK